VVKVAATRNNVLTLGRGERKGGIVIWFKRTAFILSIVLLLTSQISLATSQEVPLSTIFGPKTFIRPKGRPEPIFSRTFSVVNPLSDFSIEVTNGKEGENKVAKGTIYLNDQEVINITHRDDSVTQPIPIPPAENIIRVDLKGRPGSFIKLKVLGRVGLKEIPDLSPLELLPDNIVGYSAGRKSWALYPIEAERRYNPIDPAVASRIDFIMVSMAKFDSSSQAEERLNREKDRFPLQSQVDYINGHPIYFGLYDEAHPELFPYHAILAWTRDNWFFSVRIFPVSLSIAPSPPAEYMYELAMDFGQQIGY